MTVTTYGNPPPPDTCTPVGDDGITTEANQAFLNPVVTTHMVPGALGRPLPPVAIARQLRLKYAGKPVTMTVEGRTYYVSKEGWCVT